MPLPQVDINDLSVNMLPSEQRKPKWILFVQALASADKRLYEWLLSYKNGDNAEYYNSSYNYNIGAIVRYGYKTYESLIDGNAGNVPDINSDKWLLRNGNFIGVDERAAYNGRYLNLTYQLNRYFQKQLTDNGYVGFRQPPYPPPYGNGSQFSDIYITNVAVSISSFVVGQDESDCSQISTFTSTGFIGQTESFTDVSTYQFDINFPDVVYNAIGSSVEVVESIVRAFVDKYVPSGIKYNIYAV